MSAWQELFLASATTHPCFVFLLEKAWYALRMAWYRGYRPQPTAIQLCITRLRETIHAPLHHRPFKFGTFRPTHTTRPIPSPSTLAGAQVNTFACASFPPDSYVYPTRSLSPARPLYRINKPYGRRGRSNFDLQKAGGRRVLRRASKISERQSKGRTVDRVMRYTLRVRLSS